MTNKQTIDGVSRELLEIYTGRKEGDWVEAGHELRALLESPSVNTDVRTILLDIVPGEGSGREVYAKSCEDVEKLLTELWLRIEDMENTPKPAAQPQGEVERLRYKAELYDEVWELATGLGYMNVTTAIGTLRNQLAERDALLRISSELLKTISMHTATLSAAKED